MKFATYVFLDLATSPKEDPEPGITEISMVALERSDISTLEETLPRLRNKLTMCIKTDKELPPNYKLNNEVLKDETPFDQKVFDIINLFLRCQKKPLCLIAHNGFDFDFPILATHLKKIDVWLDEDIMCTDSLYTFYDVENKDPKLWKQQQSLSSGPKPLRLGRDIFYGNDPKPKKGHYKLIQVYSRALGYSIQSNPKSTKSTKPTKSTKSRVDLVDLVGLSTLSTNHVSENDAILIVEVFIEWADRCVEWVDVNYCRFLDYKDIDTTIQEQDVKNLFVL